MNDQALELVASIESSFADVAEKLEMLSDIESGMASLIEAIRDHKSLDLAPLVGVLKALNPSIRIEVPPAPAPIVHFLPAPVECEFELRIPSTSYGMEDRVLKITRTVKQLT